MTEIITEQKKLDALCKELEKERFITVDTEFIRDSSYWAKLCLIQVAAGDRDDIVEAIDPLAEGLDLSPFHALLQDPQILKVMHGCRQDIEIFFHETGHMPQSVFDTQIAGMVCGFGDQISYEKLVKHLVGADIDKSSRFTNWQKRPLNDKQLSYALSDVTYLRDIFKNMETTLEKNERGDWIIEEHELLLNPNTYDLNPENAWKRLKIRTSKKDVIARLQVLSAWRETLAQRRNRPRARIMRDDVIQNLALQSLKTIKDFNKTRHFPKDIAEKDLEALLADIKKAKEPRELPQPPKPYRSMSNQAMATIELLRVLLKYTCEEHHIAPKLLATASDLEAIAQQNNADVPALKGWRFKIFGEKALALKNGEYGVAIQDGKVKFFPIDQAILTA